MHLGRRLNLAMVVGASVPIDHNQYRDIQNQYRDIQLFHARRKFPVICAGARSVEMSQPRH